MSIYNKQLPNSEPRIIPEISKHFKKINHKKFEIKDIKQLIKNAPLQRMFLGSFKNNAQSSVNQITTYVYYIPPRLTHVEQDYSEDLSEFYSIEGSSFYKFEDVNQYFITPPTLVKFSLSNGNFSQISVTNLDTIFTDTQNNNCHTFYREISMNVYHSSALCIGYDAISEIQSYLESHNLNNGDDQIPSSLIEDTILNFWRARANEDILFEIKDAILKLKELNLIDDDFIEKNEENELSEGIEDSIWDDDEGDDITISFSIGRTLIYKAQQYFIEREFPQINQNEISKELYQAGITFWNHYINGERYEDPSIINYTRENMTRLESVLNNIEDVIELDNKPLANHRNEYLVYASTNVLAGEDIENIPLTSNRYPIYNPPATKDLKKEQVKPIIESLSKDVFKKFIRNNKDLFINNLYNWENVTLKISSKHWMGDIYALDFELTGNLEKIQDSNSESE